MRVSTIARFLVEPPPAGMAQPTEDPAGITLLADGYRRLDARSRLAPGTTFSGRSRWQGPADLRSAAEMIYWERARRRPRVSQRLDQRRIDARGRPEVGRPAAECPGSFRRAHSLISHSSPRDPQSCPARYPVRQARAGR